MFIKKAHVPSSVDVNYPLYEQEIFLQQPYRNFASVKEGFIECLDFTRL